MKASGVVVGVAVAVAVPLLALVGACKGKSECPKVEAPPAPLKPTPVEVAKPKDDPIFLRVDRDQLAALCLATHLPAGTYPSDYGALSLSDGTRVPWLTVWGAEAAAKAQDKPYVPEKVWLAAAKDEMEHTKMVRDDPGLPKAREGWANVVCDGDEPLRVVITAVFFEKDHAYAVAIRGSKVAEQAMPPTAAPQAVFRRAFELTDQLLGNKSATIAAHTLIDGAPLATVDADVWVKAAKSP